MKSCSRMLLGIWTVWILMACLITGCTLGYTGREDAAAEPVQRPESPHQTVQGIIVNKEVVDEHHRILVVTNVTSKDLREYSSEEIIKQAMEERTIAWYTLTDKTAYDTYSIGERIRVTSGPLVLLSQPPVLDAVKIEVSDSGSSHP
ncbi:DUF3221 domain-containing protein [Paenibacillus lutrae]|uniref:DUF3221 domain-containing protein n=1 Tax=Paenibacillus lutrae TaxID=2078573 RepID=A0A7X3FLQ7_9BACL|nr:DUF3221 domain-containing protein [Paenibacillus lutrae]MVP01947.1 DUF3221 domain-containing protein [Paenibacillus lutrae]